MSDASELIEQAKEEIADTEQRLAAVNQQIEMLEQQRNMFVQFIAKKRSALEKAVGAIKTPRKK